METEVRKSADSVKSKEDPKDPWALLALYLFMTFIGGIIFWGWYGVQDLLYKAGSFEELCATEKDISYVRIGSSEYIDCGKRKAGINNLFTIAYSCQFGFTLVMGFLIDHVGPKYTYMAAQMVNCISWILVGSFPKNKHVLRLSFFLMGATSEATYLSLTTITYFFKKHRAFIICLVGSCLSLSYVNPLVLSKIFEIDYFTAGGIFFITTGYAIFGNLVCLVLGFFFIHKKIPDDVKYDKTELELSVTVDKEAQKVELSRRERVKKYVENMSKTVRSKEFILFVISSSLFMSAFEFINKSQREILMSSDGRTSVHIFKYLQFMNFLPTPFFGLLIDRIGPAMVAWILYFLEFIFYFFVSFDNYGTKMIAVWFYYLVGSTCVSDMASYVAKRFPPENYGTLVGIIMLSIGVISLVNIPLYNMATNSSRPTLTQRFRPPIIIMMGYLIVALVIAYFLIRISYQKEDTKKN